MILALCFTDQGAQFETSTILPANLQVKKSTKKSFSGTGTVSWKQGKFLYASETDFPWLKIDKPTFFA